MSDFAAPAHLRLGLSARRASCLAAVAMGVDAGALAARLSPTLGPAVLIGAATALAGLGSATLGEVGEASLFARGFAGVAAGLAALAVAGLEPERLERLFGLLSLALLVYGARRAGAASRLRFGLSFGAGLALAAILVAALAAYNVYYVLASQDLMIADFMFYRLVSVAVGTLTRAGAIVPLLMDLSGSMARDYSWAPAIVPGFALAAFGLLSRTAYQGAIVVAYAAPALFALAWLALAIAREAGRRRAPTLAAYLFAAAAVAAAYPQGIAVAARGMPDIGGLALFALALKLAERLARTLALPPGQASRVRSIARKLAFALALTLFALFLFRRWFAFADVALVAALGGEILVAAVRRGRQFRWRETALAASVGGLTLLAALSPVLADWLPDPAAHDYAKMYAAYRKTDAVLAAAVGDWCGFGILALGGLGGAFLLARAGSRGRLTRMLAVSAPLSAALFLRVQSPYPHHLYLIAPALAVFLAAPLALLFARSRPLGLAGLAALGLATLTPAGALAPKGVFPTGGRPHAPRADLAELARLKAYVDARATPAHKVCGLGSSYTFSGQLIDELWQLKADKSPLVGKPMETNVGMTDVDTVDGPPRAAIRECAEIIVGDPVQTHVIPSYQLTVTLPAEEMLEGTGIGAHYRRTGEVFALEHDVKAIVFERTAPLEEADMAALAARWRAARAVVEGSNPH